MAKHETTIAYARAKKQWPGLLIKNYMPRHRGYPDLTLIWGRVIFAEVKWLSKPSELPKIAPLQWDWLKKLADAGAMSFLLAAHDGHDLGNGKKPGWLAWRAPVPRCFSERDGDRLGIRPWWVGEDLKHFGIRVDDFCREC